VSFDKREKIHLPLTTVPASLDRLTRAYQIAALPPSGSAQPTAHGRLRDKAKAATLRSHLPQKSSFMQLKARTSRNSMTWLQLKS